MSTFSQNADARAIDPGFVQLMDYLIAETGLEYYRDKYPELIEYFRARIGHLRLADFAAYRRHLSDSCQGADEFKAVIGHLAVSETFFFRHPEVFDALRERVLPEIIARNQRSRSLRLWSAGCSSGAEAFSLAITLKRDLAHLTDGWDIDIRASDINHLLLSRAADGVFEDWALRAVPEDIRNTCFARRGSAWQVARRYRDCVTFQHHNLAKDPFPKLPEVWGTFDLILCRNVLIYFSPLVMRRVIGGLHSALSESGWLVVGHAEPNVDLFRSFRTENVPGAVLYQKGGVSPESVPVALAARQAVRAGSAVPPVWFSPPANPSLRPARARRVDTAGSCFPHSSKDQNSEVLASVRDLADLGNLDAAVAACRSRLLEDRPNPLLFLALGTLLDQKGDIEEAERCLKRALYLDRGCALAHFHLGDIQKRRSRHENAARCFRNVLDLLSSRRDEEPVTGAEGLTVGNLARLARIHLEAVKNA